MTIDEAKAQARDRIPGDDSGRHRQSCMLQYGQRWHILTRGRRVEPDLIAPHCRGDRDVV